MTETAKKTVEIHLDQPEDQKGRLKHYGGSQSDLWNKTLISQAANSVMVLPDDLRKANCDANATVAAMRGVAPKDELEGIIAAQLLAAHNSAMECYRRAMLENQTLVARDSYLNQANKLSRTSATLIESLNKHRGKGQQKVTVEHVHVHSGGQAIVGSIEAGGGGDKKTREQGHAIAHASQPTLRSEDEERDALPIPRDG